MSLIWPVLIQARKNHEGRYDKAESELDPDQAGFLNAWVQQITGERCSQWKVLCMGYPPRSDNVTASRAYSEFCYLHPFVRNFLYVTRDDIRAHAKSVLAEQDCQSEQDVERLIAESVNRNMRILERADVGGATLTVDYKMRPNPKSPAVPMQSTFAIKSCWMYLFDTQIALVELQLVHESTDGENHLSLRDVLHLQDVVRRLYAPYWSMWRDGLGGVNHRTGHLPSKMTLHLAGQEQEVEAIFGDFSVQAEGGKPETAERAFKEMQSCNPEFERRLGDDSDARREWKIAQCQREYVYFHREPHTNAVWRKLLEPLVPMHLVIPGCDKIPRMPARDFALRYEHIQDERVALLGYIGIGQTEEQKNKRREAKTASPETESMWNPVRRISTGDWMRLAFLDDEGDSFRYPYSPEFFGAHPLEGSVYDRFWHSTGLPPAQASFHTTRWLCSGYGFLAVGDAEAHDFFADEQAGALCHFHHHYFALSLIAHFHRASLLRYKHRLAESADCLMEEEDKPEVLRNDEFRKRTEALSKELMRFTTLYWFSEVSNQVQGMELFNMYREHLNLQTLFDDVQRDISNAANLLRQWTSERQARDAQRLAVLGAIFLVVAPLLALLEDRWRRSPLLAVPLLFGLLIAIIGIYMPFERHIWWQKLRWNFVSRNKRRTHWLAVMAKDIRRFFTKSRRIWTGVLVACALGLLYLSCDNLQRRTIEPRRPGGRAAHEQAVDDTSSQAVGNQGTSPDGSSRSDQPANQSSNDSSGSKSSEPVTAPQNPNSGSMPPDQDAGGGGAAATSRPTSGPTPKKPTSDGP